LGATMAPWLGTRLGAGPAILAARAIYPVAWALAALAPVISPVLLFVALALHGLASGAENANEMGYRQAVTPDDLLGRVNGTIRSVNRTAGAAGALLGGFAVALLGDVGALTVAIALFSAAVLIGFFSPMRRARHDE